MSWGNGMVLLQAFYLHRSDSSQLNVKAFGRVFILPGRRGGERKVWYQRMNGQFFVVLHKQLSVCVHVGGNSWFLPFFFRTFDGWNINAFLRETRTVADDCREQKVILLTTSSRKWASRGPGKRYFIWYAP